MNHTKAFPALWKLKESMQVLSRPRLSAKVSAKPSEGARVSRKVKEFLTKRY